MIQIKGDNELILYFNKMASKTKPKMIDGLKDASKHLQKKIQEKFGKYQTDWAPLKRATVLAKYRRKSMMSVKKTRFNKLVAKRNTTIGSDNPLVLYSNLQRNVDYEINISDLSATIFNDEPYAAVHEYGYKNVPSRSYMRSTLNEEQDEVFKIIDKKISDLI